jgi:hypothetical protein
VSEGHPALPCVLRHMYTMPTAATAASTPADYACLYRIRPHTPASPSYLCRVPSHHILRLPCTLMLSPLHPRYAFRWSAPVAAGALPDVTAIPPSAAPDKLPKSEAKGEAPCMLAGVGCPACWTTLCVSSIAHAWWSVPLPNPKTPWGGGWLPEGLCPHGILLLVAPCQPI